MGQVTKSKKAGNAVACENRAAGKQTERAAELLAILGNSLKKAM